MCQQLRTEFSKFSVQVLREKAEEAGLNILNTGKKVTKSVLRCLLALLTSPLPSQRAGSSSKLALKRFFLYFCVILLLHSSLLLLPLLVPNGEPKKNSAKYVLKTHDY